MPHQVAQVAAGQKRESARHDARADVSPHHGLAVLGDVAMRQGAKGLKDADQGIGHKQVDGCVACNIGKSVIADKHGREGGGQHERDPSVAKGAVQLGPRHSAFASPDGYRANGNGGQRAAHMDGDKWCELHGPEYGRAQRVRQGLCDEMQRGRRETQASGAVNAPPKPSGARPLVFYASPARLASKLLPVTALRCE